MSPKRIISERSLNLKPQEAADANTGEYTKEHQPSSKSIHSGFLILSLYSPLSMTSLTVSSTGHFIEYL